jgi:hypothetical protein
MSDSVFCAPTLDVRTEDCCARVTRTTRNRKPAKMSDWHANSQAATASMSAHREYLMLWK